MKKERIISTILIFMLCFLTHFIYDIFPCTLTSIFFPVNESIWEHMKMLFTTILFYHVLEAIYFNIKKIKYDNFWIAALISSIISIPIYLVIFLPIYYNIGENMLVTLIILLITILIIEYINYKILEAKMIPYGSIIAMLATIISYITFAYLTYNPPKIDIFFDTENEKYGINDYII